MKARNYCFTINYPNRVGWHSPESAEEVKYLVWQMEEGEESHIPHIQGYVEFDRPMPPARVKRLFACNSMHLEKRKGTAHEAAIYCKKEDTRKEGEEYHEFGKISKPGKRTDLETIGNAINSGASMASIATEYPATFIRYHRGMMALALVNRRSDMRSLQVKVYWGASGTGKTQAVWRENPDVYSKPSGNWWDGYDGQDAILLDDFYGETPYAELLRILDVYPLRVPVKGGFVQANWTKVFITSNTHPKDWYVDEHGAFKRRVHEIVRFLKPIGTKHTGGG